MPKISVIIPVYNTEKYLKKCLDSILNQTFTDFEAICINDGSTDGSAQILADYANKDVRIKIISQENRGLSEARNAGLKMAIGEYITFLDSDDWLPEYALQTLYEIAQKSGSKIVTSNKYIKISTNKKTPKQLNSQYKIINNPMAELIRMPKTYSSSWNKLYKAELLKNYRFINNIYFEDWPFILVLFSKIKDFACTKIPCYMYRDNACSISRSDFSEKKINSYMVGIRYVDEYFKNTEYYKYAQKRILVALKMCINKTYKDKKNRQKIASYLVKEVEKLKVEKNISVYSLPIKQIYRYLRLKLLAKKYK